jgi:glutathione S-transferase
MGLAASAEDEPWEQPSERHDATLYYFAGRGLADQIRWMLAATNVPFTQKVISQRSQFERMSKRQLPFGQLPLLQIDGLEIVQSQAAVRYLARRAQIHGRTPEEMLKCDMIAEAVRDLLGPLCALPFKRCAANATPSSSENGTSSSATTTDSTASNEAARKDYEALLQSAKEKWAFTASRFEAVLETNNKSKRSDSTAGSSSSANNTANMNPDIAAYNGAPDQLFLVGRALSYADILVAHATTWFIEECGLEVVMNTPKLVQLQNQVLYRYRCA